MFEKSNAFPNILDAQVTQIEASFMLYDDGIQFHRLRTSQNK